MRNFAAVVGCFLCVWAGTVTDSRAEQADATFHRGLIEASEVIEVSSQVPGIIENVAVERGDRIQQGQVLATLKADVEKAQVELANARLEFGRRKVLRNEELYQKQLISIHEKDEMETEVHVMAIQLRDAQERLNLRTILSPVDGVVVERHLGPGEYIGEGSIMKIARVDPLNVEVIVPSSLYGTIVKGMKAEVRPENPIGGSHQGQVVIVDEVVDAASGTFGVRVQLPNPGHKLPAGINCQARFFK
ncbi:MAG: efflux RND transporter periplasmic adaptor subunit [Thermodesulfobacteriota bacterium]